MTDLPHASAGLEVLSIKADLFIFFWSFGLVFSTYGIQGAAVLQVQRKKQYGGSSKGQTRAEPSNPRQEKKLEESLLRLVCEQTKNKPKVKVKVCLHSGDDLPPDAPRDLLSHEPATAASTPPRCLSEDRVSNDGEKQMWRLPQVLGGGFQ